MLLTGYFEGIGSQRGIAWRCSDSLSLRKFLGIAPTEDSPDHSSLSLIRGRLPLEVHNAVFVWVLKLARERGLLNGETVGVDSTTLEANAAMKSIVRRDTGEDWQAYVTGVPAGDVAAVRFLIDGQLRYLTRTAPYVFAGRGNLLLPGTLGPGSHIFAVDVTLTNGHHLTTAAAAVVSAKAPGVPGQGS